MRVRDNWTSLVSWRAFSGASFSAERSMSRLSSGQRVNTAADDAAGLSISERLRTQFNGLRQATQNAMDGLSLVQTADGALREVTEMLQRARELSVQAANGTWTDTQKASLQRELTDILSEVDRVADSTSFNGIQLIAPAGSSGAMASVLNGLRSGWLQQSEKVIQQWYGIIGDGSTLTISLEQQGADAAWITGARNTGTGQLDNIVLHINLAAFGTGGGPDGGTGPYYNDRKVARALTQAVIARNSDFATVDPWFVSGASDFISGRNEALKADVAQYGAPAVVNAMNDVLTGTWVDDELHRTAAFAAVSYLNSQISPFKMSNIMAQLRLGSSLDAALTTVYGTGVNGFVSTFLSGAGLAYVNSLNLAGPDVGGIGGGDASAVIPNGAVYSVNPLANFAINWSANGQALGGKDSTMDFILQVGANAGDTMKIQLPVINTITLDLLGLDLVKGATEALQKSDRAIGIVSAARAQLGAASNRLEHTINANNAGMINQTASFSTIRDLDMAKEMTNLTRQQVLLQSSGAMLAQANASRQNVMWLLNGLPKGGAAAFGM